MNAQRARRALSTVLALLLVLAITPMTAAAQAESRTAQQEVWVGVTEPGVLAIDVDHQVYFGEVYWNQTSAEREFNIEYRNTKDAGTDWSATVVVSDFERWEWDDTAQSEIMTGSFSADGMLTIFRGHNQDWYDQGVRFGGDMVADAPAATAVFGATGTPITMMTAGGTNRGTIHPNEYDESSNAHVHTPWLQLQIPHAQPEGGYAATLTYTLTG